MVEVAAWRARHPGLQRLADFVEVRGHCNGLREIELIERSSRILSSAAC